MKRKKRTRPTKSSRKIISKDERDKVARFQRIWILFDQILPRCKNFLSTFNLDENSIRRGIFFEKIITNFPSIRVSIILIFEFISIEARPIYNFDRLSIRRGRVEDGRGSA